MASSASAASLARGNELGWSPGAHPLIRDGPQHPAPRPGVGCCRVGIAVLPGAQGRGQGRLCHLGSEGCQRRRPCAVATCLPQKGFIAGFGIGKQLTQQVLGRELEVHPHPSISQLGAVRCHRPAMGTMAGMGIWGQPKDRLRLRSPCEGGDNSPRKSQAAFPGGHLGRGRHPAPAGWDESSTGRLGFPSP